MIDRRYDIAFRIAQKECRCATRFREASSRAGKRMYTNSVAGHARRLGGRPLFAITMLLNTEQGGTYSLEEYTHWLEEAGLSEVRCTSIDADRQLVTAVRGS